ncbi:MAG: T9SS type A sorting domain-containing protein [Candidatus Zixiibacteriota bacterium]|nr:MAG: T9SS type A sorting domain-containing protein [candidate division Zixibacteria bacterium]
MKRKMLFVALVLAVALSGTVAAQSPPAPAVWIDCETDIEGLVNGKIPAGSGQTITLKISFHNTDDALDYRTAISNGFWFDSPDITIGSIDVSRNPAYDWTLEEAIPNGCWPPTCYSWFDMVFTITDIPKGLGGKGLAGLAGDGDGLPPSFDDWAYLFTLSDVNNPGTSEWPDGGFITVDTSWWAPSNLWLWTGVGGDISWAEGELDEKYYIGGPSTDVIMVSDAGVPNRFALNQNYPNPFNPTTTAQFDIARRCHVSIKVYNVLGQPVATLVDEELGVGTYSTEWNGRNKNGEQVSSGVYLCRMKAGDFKQTIKMLMVQ